MTRQTSTPASKALIKLSGLQISGPIVATILVFLLYIGRSSLSLIELFDLRNNYKSLSYSTTEVDVQIQRIVSFPFYFTLMTILAAILMFNTKKLKNTTLKLAIGLFASVIIYYMNNFFMIMGNTEKIPVLLSIWMPLFVLLMLNSIGLLKINEK